MGSLYQIANRQQNLLDLLKSGDVDEETLAPALAEIQQDLVAKGADYIAVLTQLENFTAGVDMEIKRLTDYKKSLKNNQERMRTALMNAMRVIGTDCIATPRGTIKTKWNPDCTIIDDAAVIPTEYTRTEIKIVPDKMAIKSAIKAGQLVPGAHLEKVQRVEVK